MFRFLVVLVVVCALFYNAMSVSMPQYSVDISSWADAEVQETNLRAEAKPEPLNGFIVFSISMDTSCNSNSVQTVMPLNRCIPDEMGLSGSRYFKGTMLPNMKIKTQGYTDSACHTMGRQAKFKNFPVNMCMPMGTDTSGRFWYSPNRPTYPFLYGTRTYGSNECNGKNYVSHVYTGGCFNGDTGTTSMSMDCVMGIVSFDGPNCSGPYTVLEVPRFLNVSQCEKQGRYFGKTGCSQSLGM